AHAASKLAAYKSVYEKSLAGIESDYRTERDALGKRYSQALVRILGLLHDKGDKANLAGVKAEAKRFLKEKTVPKQSPSGTYEMVARAQQVYRRTEGELLEERGTRERLLLEKYIKRLEALTPADAATRKEIDWAWGVYREFKKAAALAAAIPIPTPPVIPRKKPAAPPRPTPRPLPALGPIPGPLRADVLLYYSFDRITGGKVEDLSGNGMHGEATKVSSYSRGQVRGAVSFRSKREVLLQVRHKGEKYTHVPIGENDFSILVWLKPNLVDDPTVLFSQVNKVASPREHCGLNFGYTGDGTVQLHVLSTNSIVMNSEASMIPHQRKWVHLGLTVEREGRGGGWLTGM
ncbi:MAG: hypothetical protein AAF492_31430, partial [Verrucomicrobiota bacterium]